MSTKYRINLKDAVDDLAPPPPSCFFNKVQWVEYLKSAAAVQNHKGEPRVIIMENGTPAFNRELNFCVDCYQQKSVEMMAKGRCNPDDLKKSKTLTPSESVAP